MPTTAVECETCEALQDEVEELKSELADTKRELELVQSELLRRREQVQEVAHILEIIGHPTRELHKSDVRDLSSTARGAW